jgi:hypothetical protein
MKAETTRWELAGLTLQRQLPSASLPVPSGLEIDGPWLTSQSLQPEDRQVTPPADLLLRFTRISTPEDVLGFARKFGVLRLAEKRNGRFCRERLDLWLHLARQGRALLNIASAVHQDRSPALDDWRSLYEGTDRSLVQWLEEKRRPSPEFAQFLLSMVVNGWLTMCDARPMFQWLRDGPRITFDCHLRSALAMGLLVAVTRTEGVAVCSTCGRPYLRCRRPKRGQHNYCPDCGKRGAWRSAARRRSRRSRTSASPTRRRATRALSARERASRLMALSEQLGPAPRGRGAGQYWRRFHAKAKALELVTGRSYIASQMACLRARRAADVGVSAVAPVAVTGD